MAILQKPQPSAMQVATLDFAIELWKDSPTKLRPGMYESGNMLLMLVPKDGTVVVLRIDRAGKIISES